MMDAPMVFDPVAVQHYLQSTAVVYRIEYEVSFGHYHYEYFQAEGIGQALQQAQERRPGVEIAGITRVRVARA